MDTYDSLTANAVALLKQEIENNYQSLQTSANLVAKAGVLDKSKIFSLLPLLAEGRSYIDIAIVSNEGQGYNMAGDYIDVL